MKKVKRMAETGKARVSSGRSSHYKSDLNFWDQFIFVGAQLSKSPVDYFFGRKIATKIKVAGKIKIELPVVFAGMSFGSLSQRAKKALALASSRIGTLANTGEGGILKEEINLADNLIMQYSTGRFGLPEKESELKNLFAKVEGIEIKIGQGAKPGQGGLLPKRKVTPLISRVRGVSQDQDVHSPASHPDIDNIKDLRQKISQLRELSGEKPIILKLAAGSKKDIELAVKANPDVIAIDGISGGTGAAPTVLLNQVGLPTLPALVSARRILNKYSSPPELWIGGGIENSAQIAKAIALGADAVFMGTALLVAMGCIRCGNCHLGKCPKGIATQDKDLEKNLDISEAAHGVTNYMKVIKEELRMITGAVGKEAVSELGKNDLRCLDKEIAKETGVKWIF